MLPAVKSAGRITPRTVTNWCSELTSTSFVPSSTRYPLGSTCVTRALSVAVMVEPRDVVPAPFRVCVLDVFSRLDNAPPGLLGASKAVMELVAAEARDVCVAPVATADADSLTTMVTRSST